MTSSFAIYEPTGNSIISPDLIDLAIVPGLAFDSNNNRLGYGKGYYHELLAKMNVYKIGICFDFQVLDNIPNSENDIRMDTLIMN